MREASREGIVDEFTCFTSSRFTFSRRDQGSAGHFGGLGEFHHVQSGGGDVGEAAVFQEFFAFEAVVHDDQLDVVVGVGGVGAAGGWVDHLLAVAVIGGDDGA